MVKAPPPPPPPLDLGRRGVSVADLARGAQQRLVHAGYTAAQTTQPSYHTGWVWVSFIFPQRKRAFATAQARIARVLHGQKCNHQNPKLH
jgi:hypothetical protein